MLRNSVSTLHKARKDEGFTLIELLIVIVILGVLAAIVVFSVRGITNTGEVAACEANEKTAMTAIEAYYANAGSGAYPATLADLVPNYLASDPSAGDPQVAVTYTSAAPHTTYTLTSGSAC